MKKTYDEHLVLAGPNGIWITGDFKIIDANISYPLIQRRWQHAQQKSVGRNKSAEQKHTSRKV